MPPGYHQIVIAGPDTRRASAVEAPSRYLDAASAMRLRHLGYACSNLSIPCTTGRTFRLASLSEERAMATIDENLTGLLRTLRWNVDHGIHFFRISSDVVPFASHEAFPFDWLARFADRLAEIRDFAADHGVRLTMHPGQYTVLNSPRPEVVDAAIAELAYQADFISAVAPETGTLTLHVGGGYGDKTAALERFAENFRRLTPRAQETLILENDDKTYHVADVLPLCEALGVPLVFDYFHHLCHHPGSTPDVGLLEQLERVVATWGGAVPKFHLSSRREGTKTSHADYLLREDLDAFTALMAGVGGDEPYDVMVEAKAKDQAVLALLDEEAVTPPGR